MRRFITALALCATAFSATACDPAKQIDDTITAPAERYDPHPDWPITNPPRCTKKVCTDKR